MPNWAEGTLKLRGTTENIVSALKEMLLENQGATLEEEYDGTLLRFKTENDYFYINGTRRAYISGEDIEIWVDDDDYMIIELEDFKQAWAASADNYTEISSRFDVDIKIFTFEKGLGISNLSQVFFNIHFLLYEIPTGTSGIEVF